MIKGINDQEKAALYFQVLERCEDWQRVFKIAIGAERYNNLSDKAKQTSSSRWKNSASVQLSLREIQTAIKAKENQIREETKKAPTEESAELREQKTKRATIKTDFLNRDEFLQFLNEKANENIDDKLRNEILKMLSDNLRYKDSDKESENDIQRFYTPVLCESCEIYNKCKGCKVAECPKM